MTPNRADATCLIALRRESPFGVGHVALRILAALAGIRPAAEAVHRDRQRLVRFAADRAVRHRAGREPLQDRLDRLDLVDRHRAAGRLQAEQPAQRRAVLVLLVDQPRVLLEDGVLAGAGRVLQLEHRLRIEEVVLAVAPPLVLAAAVELLRASRPRTEGALVAPAHLFGNHVDADAADARHRVREVAVDERLVQADRLEDLRAAVALQRRDPHLRHHLEDALVERLDVVRDRLVAVDARAASPAGSCRRSSRRRRKG